MESLLNRKAPPLQACSPLSYPNEPRFPMLTPLTDATCAEALAGTSAGVLLFYKKLCPHCKNMEKVLEKFAGLEPEAALYAVDIEEHTAAAGQYQAERAPTLLIIKNGQVVDRKAGLMNPKELLAWYESV